MKKGLLLLAVFFLAQAFVTGYYVRKETRPPSWDQANHLDVALQYREALKKGELSVLLSFKPKHYIPPFPPLYHLAMVPFCGGEDPARSVLLLNLAYLLILGLAIFGMAADEKGAAAAVCFMAAPVVQDLVHTQLIDLPLTACAAAATWAWMRSDGFRDRKGSLLLGLLFAVGMLHKWSFFSYMLPVYISSFRALREPGRRRNMLLAAGLAAALSAPWYCVRFFFLLQRLVQASADQAVPFWRGGAFFGYLRVMPWEFGIVFSFMAAIAAWRSAKDPALRPLLLGIAGAYIFWAVVPNRQMRYLLPGLPALAVLMARTLPGKALWLLLVLQCVGIARPADPPKSEDWRLRDIVERIGGPAEVAVAANDRFFNNLSLLYTAQLLDKDIRFHMAQNKLWELMDFVLLKEGRLGPVRVIEGLSDIREAVRTSKGFAEAGRWPLPDGSAAVLYEHRRSVPKPFPGREAKVPEWRTALSSLRDVRLEFGRWDPKASVYETVRLSSPGGALKFISVSSVTLVLEGALPMAEGTGMRLLRLKRMRVVSMFVEAQQLNRLPVPVKLRLRLEGRRLRAGLGPLDLLEISFLDDSTVLRTLLWAGLERTFPFAVGLKAVSVRDGGIEIR